MNKKLFKTKKMYAFVFAVALMFTVLFTNLLSTNIVFADTTELPVIVGYRPNDGSPTDNCISYWESTGALSMSYQNCSIGLDFGQRRKVTQIKLKDDNTTGNGNGTTYELYQSDDNHNFALFTSWSFSSATEGGRLVHTFSISNVTAQYIKIHTTYDPGDYSFRFECLRTDVKAYGDLRDELYKIPGFIDSDTSPTTNAIGNWGSSDGNFPMDYNRESIGADLLSQKAVNRIELWDTNNDGRGDASSYKIYGSNDNDNYTEITNNGSYTVTFNSGSDNGRKVHSFDISPAISYRYIKVNSQYTDTGWNFNIGPIQSSFRIFGSNYTARTISDVGYKNQDTSPTNNAITDWTTDSFCIDEQQRSLGIDFGSSVVVNKIEIKDSDEIFRGLPYENSMPLTEDFPADYNVPCDYDIYWSNTNSSGSYVKIPGFVFSTDNIGGHQIHTFEFSGVTARYIKVHTRYPANDTSGNFLLENIQAVNQSTSTVKAYYLPTASYMMPTSTGCLEYDTSPTTGSIGTFEETDSSYAFDLNSRSIAVDIGMSVPVDAIEVLDSNTSTTVEQSDYTLYYSNNDTSYAQITGWSFETRTEGDSQLVHKFSFSGVTARYIKIHNSKASGSTFIVDLANGIRAYSSKEALSSANVTNRIEYYHNPDKQLNKGQGGIIKLKNGNILMAYDTGWGYGDGSPGWISGVVSTDGGYTWGTPYVLLDTSEDVHSVGACTLLRMNNGDLGLFYNNIYEDSQQYSYVHFRRSTDEGITWSDPINMNDTPGYYMLSNGRVTKTPSGTILIPVAYVPNSSYLYSNNDVAYVYYSNNDGNTWTRSTDGVHPPNGAWEPGVNWMSNGSIIMNIRDGNGGSDYNIWRSISSDGGDTWTTPEKTGLQTPSSMSNIYRIPTTGDLLMIWNNYAPYAHGMYLRSFLSSAISSDGGKTWSHFKTFEASPYQEFTQTPVIMVGRQVIMFYGDGPFDPVNYTSNSSSASGIRIVDISWFYN